MVAAAGSNPHLRRDWCVLYGSSGATRGVTVSMSAFLACHQCYCAGSSLAWGLNLWVVVCELVTRGFLRVLRFPPLLDWFNGSVNKIKLK